MCACNCESLVTNFWYRQAGLQIGGHGGMRLTQCQAAVLRTMKAIPVQIDGEPCRLAPSCIRVSFRNKACMIQRPKFNRGVPGALGYVTVIVTLSSVI